jgi:excisionase family DNA binding protein
MGFLAVDAGGAAKMTVKQFAEKAEISLSLAYQLIAEGQVPHRRMGQRGKRGAIRITEEDFERFIKSTKIEEVAG